LFSGYSRAQYLELDLESIGLGKNVEAFFENCSDKEYYRFFAPLCPRHPFPYNKSPLPMLPGLSSLIHIDVGLLALGNLVEGENTLRAGFKICAKWQPAQQEIRKAKYHSSNTDSQDPLSMIEYRSLPLGDDELQAEIFTSRFMGNGTSYAPPLFLSSTSSLEEKNFGSPDFDRIVVDRPIPGNVQLSATVNISVSLLTDGNFQRFPFDTRVATFHLTAGLPLREMKFGTLCEWNIGQKAYELSQANDWIVDPNDVKVTHMYRDLHSRDWYIGDTTYRSISLYREGSEDRKADMRDRCKILVQITFRRNSHSWFWKILFPIDVITTVGFGIFLLIPEVPEKGPSTDQRIALTTALVTVLLAQAAFTISARPFLPKVSHMTMLDIHNNFCFVLTALQAVLFAAIPGPSWETFGDAKKRYPTFVGAIFLLVLEHIYIIHITHR
jgi:hypothetical protein